MASDYKNKRVEDPTFISPKQAKKVKKYAHDFFDRAVAKYTDYEKKKAQSAGTAASGPSQPRRVTSPVASPAKDDANMSDAGGDISPGSSTDRKRKRDDEDQVESPEAPPSETPSVKRVKEDGAEAEVEGEPSTIPSPPTPPPPPVDTPPTEEERSMREQEEALMRENEEAQRLEDEAQAQEDGKRPNGAPTRANGPSANGPERDMDIDQPPQQAQKQQHPVLSH